MTAGYNTYDSMIKSVHSCRCIDGKITGSGNCVGYCRYSEHPGFLTRELRKNHNCIKKECRYFISKPKTKRENKIVIDQSNAILHYIKENNLLPHGVRVIRVTCSPTNKYVAHYISITNDYDFINCNCAIKNSFDVEIVFENLNYSFETCASLLMAN